MEIGRDAGTERKEETIYIYTKRERESREEGSEMTMTREREKAGRNGDDVEGVARVEAREHAEG